MKTLHIHIGTPKTATTAIQKFCVENAGILEKKGYCYPLFPFSYKKVSKARNAHFLIGKIKNENGDRCKDEEEKRIAEVMQEIQKLFETYDHVILSDEDIWRNMDDGNKNLWDDLKLEAEKSGFFIHVIVYLRRQDKYFISNWNQNVKMKIGTYAESTFEEFNEKANKKTRLEYYDKLERLARIIGKENITVRRFDGGRFEGGSIYSDFLTAIGLSVTEEYDISQEVRNTGLYGNTHEIKRILNNLPMMEEKKMQSFILEMLQELSEISSKDYPSEMMSKEETVAFMKEYESGNRKITEEYLHEPGAELFDNTVKDAPKWEKDNIHMTDDLIRFVGLTAMYLYRENQELNRKLEERTSIQGFVKHSLRLVGRRLKRRKGE